MGIKYCGAYVSFRGFHSTYVLNYLSKTNLRISD